MSGAGRSFSTWKPHLAPDRRVIPLTTAPSRARSANRWNDSNTEHTHHPTPGPTTSTSAPTVLNGYRIARRARARRPTTDRLPRRAHVWRVGRVATGDAKPLQIPWKRTQSPQASRAGGVHRPIPVVFDAHTTRFARHRVRMLSSDPAQPRDRRDRGRTDAAETLTAPATSSLRARQDVGAGRGRRLDRRARS
jgi:hypothetical protein